jgi:hypothetical protein
MPVDRPRRKSLRSITVLGSALIAVALCTAAALGRSETTLAGTWSGSYTGSFTGSFALHWTQSGSTLNGKITLTNPKGTYAVGGSVSGTSISFGAVGVGATYTGSLSASGLSMSGSWKSGPASGTWKAHKLLTSSTTKVKVKAK